MLVVEDFPRYPTDPPATIRSVPHKLGVAAGLRRSPSVKLTVAWTRDGDKLRRLTSSATGKSLKWMRVHVAGCLLSSAWCGKCAAQTTGRGRMWVLLPPPSPPLPRFVSTPAVKSRSGGEEHTYPSKPVMQPSDCPLGSYRFPSWPF